jgi:hypothetical protein
MYSAAWCEKWRTIADSAVRERLEATIVHRRKGWQLGGLRASAVVPEPGKNGALGRWKSAISSQFPPLFRWFSPGFSASLRRSAQKGREKDARLNFQGQDG